MGAAMVDDPALVLFAGGIGMEGTVVDSNVDAFRLPATRKREAEEGVQQPNSGSSSDGRGRGGQGEGDVLVEKGVLS